MPVTAVAGRLSKQAAFFWIRKIAGILTPKGDEIFYQMTIEDPDYLIEPWVMPDRILRARQGAPQIIHERTNCEVYETGKITSQERH
jgi:hypothetical protein